MRKFIVNAFQKPMTAIVFSVLAGFAVGALVLAAAGYSPIAAYSAMFSGVFQKPKYMAQIAINSVPIIFTGLSVAFAYQTGLFNIGAEGQYIIGTLTAALLGRYLTLPPFLHPAVILVAAFLLGGIYGGLAGWLKTKFGVHEVISTIMLNWTAFYLNNFALTIPGVKKPNAQASHEILSSARIRILSEWKRTAEGRAFIQDHSVLGDILRTDVHLGIIFALVAVVVIWYFLNRTTKGYELRAVGAGPLAAEFAGISVKKNVLTAMFIAGGAAALGGALQIMGTNSFRISVLAAHEGYGWDGLSVSLIANNNPLGVLLSGVLFSALKYGGSSIQSLTGAPSEVINIMIGTIVFCVALRTVFPMIADNLKRGLSHDQ